MVKAQPRIAVLIPAYNAELTLHKALASLYVNAEPHDIIVIDDGSRRPLKDVIGPRDNLLILRLEPNRGITAALNFGLEHIFSKGYEFVARLDADDEASADRLARQRIFLDEHPDIGLVGSWARVVSRQGQELFCLHHPTDSKAVADALYSNSCFVHPSLMIRTSVLGKAGVYSPAYPHAEDYELVRRLERSTRLANIPAYLVNYTSSSDGISQSKRKQQLISRLRVQWAYRNFSAWRFYPGIIKTVLLLFMPASFLTELKQRLSGYRRRHEP